MDHQNRPLLKEKEIADQWMKRLYRPANHMVTNGSQLSQQYLKAFLPQKTMWKISSTGTALCEYTASINFKCAVWTWFVCVNFFTSKAFHPLNPGSLKLSL